MNKSPTVLRDQMGVVPLPVNRVALSSTNNKTLGNTAVDFSVHQDTSLITFRAIGANVFLRWGEKSDRLVGTSSDNFDEVILDGEIIDRSPPINSDTGQEYTHFNAITDDGVASNFILIQR